MSNNLSNVLKSLKGLELIISTEKQTNVKGVCLDVTADDFLILQTRSNDTEEHRKVLAISEITDLSFVLKKEAEQPQATPPMRIQGDAIAVGSNAQTTTIKTSKKGTKTNA